MGVDRREPNRAADLGAAFTFGSPPRAGADWHVVREDNDPKKHKAHQPARVIGELLAAALSLTLPSYGANVPAISFNHTSCSPKKNDLGDLLAEHRDVLQVSFEHVNHCAFFGNRSGAGDAEFLVCPGTGRGRHGDRGTAEFRAARHKLCARVSCAHAGPAVHAISSLLAFDFLLTNYNRVQAWDGDVRTSNGFVEFVGGGAGPKATRASRLSDTSWSTVLIDNEMCVWSALHAHRPCGGEADRRLSFRDYVATATGGQLNLTHDAALGCPIGPALLSDIRRHGTGDAFVSALVDAMQPARWRCVARLALRTFAPAFSPHNKREVTLRAYLAARFDSLVAGLREWGCALPAGDAARARVYRLHRPPTAP
jgi:hypothetical protein